MNYQIMDTSSFWALAGVALGFVLGEGSRLLRHWIRVGRLKKLIRDELISIRMQIPQKRAIVSRMIAELDKRQLLPGIQVGIINTGYHQHIDEVYEHLSVYERNCLHTIHERLRVADEVMNSYMDNFQAAFRDKVVKDPIVTFKTLLGDIDGSYQVVESLIDSYLKRKPIDVFNVKTATNKR
jgi:hypothetical protein